MRSIRLPTDLLLGLACSLAAACTTTFAGAGPGPVFPLADAQQDGVTVADAADGSGDAGASEVQATADVEVGDGLAEADDAPGDAGQPDVAVDPAACVPQCAGKACGPDGCGGVCGACPAEASCTAQGQCQLVCVPQCAGKACGPDGCGGACGACPAEASCTAQGQCQLACVPQCGGKACGPDGCGGVCGTCPAGATCSGGKCEAGTVTIQVLGATVAPFKATLCQWDGPCNAVTAADAAKLVDLVSAADGTTAETDAALAQLMAWLGSPAIQKLVLPDPIGTATLLSAGVAYPVVLATAKDNQENTVTPGFPTATAWSGVPLQPDLQIQVELKDEDTVLDDPIGKAVIGHEAVAQALALGGLAAVKVADQTNNQLLFVRLLVTSP